MCDLAVRHGWPPDADVAVLRRFQHEPTAIPDDQGLVLSGASASGARSAIGCAVRTHRERCECIYVKWNFWDHPRVDPACPSKRGGTRADLGVRTSYRADRGVAAGPLQLGATW